MSVFGISLVKDEADVIAATCQHMAGQVDHLLIADNASTDGTRELLEDLAGELPLTVLEDTEVAHYQSRKLTALAARAAELGADWVVPFDADELVTAVHGTVADALRRPRRTWIFTIDLFDHVATTADPAGHPFTRMGWRRREALRMPKIAARTHPDLVICEGSHSCHYAGRHPKTAHHELQTRHFPYRSPAQFLSKARNGSRGRGATDLPEDVGTHLREYGRILEADGEAGLLRLWEERFLIQDPIADESLTFDPVEL